MKPEDIRAIMDQQKPILHNIPFGVEEVVRTQRSEGENGETVFSDSVDTKEGYAPIAIIPEGMSIESLKPYIDQYAEAPERRMGTAKLDDLDSFIALTNRFKSENSVIFAQGEIAGKSVSASLLTVLNYHPEGPKNVDAAWSDHKTSYDFPISKFFKTWLNMDAKGMDQATFALFLENNIADVAAAEGVDLSYINFGAQTPVFASPSDIFLLSEGLEIRSAEKFVDKKKLSNGTGEIQFTIEHKGADGQPLKVPSWFLLGLPVFENGEAYAIPVRLRYRVSGGAITWFYELFGVEKVFDIAFKESCTQAKEDTGLFLFVGKPENE